MLKSSDPEKLPELSRKFVRVSALATITHLKKFIAIKVLNMPKDDEDIFRDIDITCEGELIPKDHTLKFVYVTRWRTKDPPLHLVYRYLYQNFETETKIFLCSPKIKLDTENMSGKDSDIPEWKLQPKLSYDDDEDN